MRILQIIPAAPGWSLVFADVEHRGQLYLDPIAAWALIEEDSRHDVIPGVGSEFPWLDLAAHGCSNVIGISGPCGSLEAGIDEARSLREASERWYDAAQAVPVEEAE